MPRYLLTDRINAAKRFGLKVEVVPGAQTRGSDAYNPGCYVGHHTAGAKTGDRPSLSLVVNGRSDLAGPLANDFMPRSGGLVIVACGRSNNAGLGGFRGIVGNSGTMACEAEDDGDGIWTPEQWRDYPRIVASGLYLMHRDQTWYCSHRTWALTPPSKPGRKIDPTGIMDPWMAAWVSVLFRNPKAVPRQGMPTAADLTSTGGFTVAEADAILKAIADVKATVNHQVAMLMFGENRDASKADPHPDSLQTLNTKLSKFIAESGARETALIAAVTKLAAAGGVPISKEEIIQTLDDAVSTGFETLDLRLVNQSLDPTPSA